LINTKEQGWVNLFSAEYTTKEEIENGDNSLPIDGHFVSVEDAIISVQNWSKDA
jgi:hypothetical protein